MKSYTLTRSDPCPQGQRKPVTLYYIDGARVSRKAYNLMRSEPDVNTCRSTKTFYYVDGVRVARDQYDSLYARATRKDCFWTRKSERCRWLFDCCVYA